MGGEAFAGDLTGFHAGANVKAASGSGHWPSPGMQ